MDFDMIDQYEDKEIADIKKKKRKLKLIFQTIALIESAVDEPSFFKQNIFLDDFDLDDVE